MQLSTTWSGIRPFLSSAIKMYSVNGSFSNLYIFFNREMKCNTIVLKDTNSKSEQNMNVCSCLNILASIYMLISIGFFKQVNHQLPQKLLKVRFLQIFNLRKERVFKVPWCYQYCKAYLNLTFQSRYIDIQINKIENNTDLPYIWFILKDSTWNNWILFKFIKKELFGNTHDMTQI